MKIYFETEIDLPYENVRDRFNQELFVELAPHVIPFKLIKFDGCKVGNIVHIQVGPKGLAQEWVSVITHEETNAHGWSFIDQGKVLPWPLTYWKHHHRVDKITANKCKIVDDIHYECSSSIISILIKPFIWSVFAIRPDRYRNFFKD